MGINVGMLLQIIATCSEKWGNPSKITLNSSLGINSSSLARYLDFFEPKKVVQWSVVQWSIVNLTTYWKIELKRFMYGIFTYNLCKFEPNVGKYAIISRILVWTRRCFRNARNGKMRKRVSLPCSPPRRGVKLCFTNFSGFITKTPKLVALDPQKSWTLEAFKLSKYGSYNYKVKSNYKRRWWVSHGSWYFESARLGRVWASESMWEWL